MARDKQLPSRNIKKRSRLSKQLRRIGSTARTVAIVNGIIGLMLSCTCGISRLLIRTQGKPAKDIIENVQKIDLKKAITHGIGHDNEAKSYIRDPDNALERWGSPLFAQITPCQTSPQIGGWRALNSSVPEKWKSCVDPSKLDLNEFFKKCDKQNLAALPFHNRKGEIFAVSYKDNSISIHDFASRKETVFKKISRAPDFERFSPVQIFDYDPDSKRIAVNCYSKSSGGFKQGISIRDSEFKQLHCFENAFEFKYLDKSKAIVKHPDKVLLVDTKDWSTLKTLELRPRTGSKPEKLITSHLAFTPGRKFFATQVIIEQDLRSNTRQPQDNKILEVAVYRSDTLELFAKTRITGLPSMRNLTAKCTPDGKELVILGNKVLIKVDLRTGKLLGIPQFENGLSKDLVTIALIEGGDGILIGNKNVYDGESGKLSAKWQSTATRFEEVGNRFIQLGPNSSEWTTIDWQLVKSSFNDPIRNDAIRSRRFYVQIDIHDRVLKNREGYPWIKESLKKMLGTRLAATFESDNTLPKLAVSLSRSGESLICLLVLNVDDSPIWVDRFSFAQKKEDREVLRSTHDVVHGLFKEIREYEPAIPNSMRVEITPQSVAPAGKQGEPFAQSVIDFEELRLLALEAKKAEEKAASNEADMSEVASEATGDVAKNDPKVDIAKPEDEKPEIEPELEKGVVVAWNNVAEKLATEQQNGEIHFATERESVVVIYRSNEGKSIRRAITDGARDQTFDLPAGKSNFLFRPGTNEFVRLFRKELFISDLDGQEHLVSLPSQIKSPRLQAQFSSSGKWFAIQTEKNDLRVVKFEDLKKVASLEECGYQVKLNPGSIVRGLCFSGNEKFLAAEMGGAEKHHVWFLAKPDAVPKLNPAVSKVRRIGLDHNGANLLGLKQLSTTKIQLGKFSTRNSSEDYFPIRNLRSFRFSTNGKYIACRTKTNLQIYDAKTLGQLTELSISSDSPVEPDFVKWSADSQFLAAASRDGNVTVWRISDVLDE